MADLSVTKRDRNGAVTLSHVTPVRRNPLKSLDRGVTCDSVTKAGCHANYSIKSIGCECDSVTPYYVGCDLHEVCHTHEERGWA